MVVAERIIKMMNSIKINYIALGITVGVALLIVLRVYTTSKATIGGSVGSFLIP